MSPTPLRQPPSKGVDDAVPHYRHWTIEEFWGFRDKVVEWANDQIIKADTLEHGGHPRMAADIRENLEPLLELIRAYQEKARVS